MTVGALSREAALAFADLLSYPDDALAGRLRADAGRPPGTPPAARSTRSPTGSPSSGLAAPRSSTPPRSISAPR